MRFLLLAIFWLACLPAAAQNPVIKRIATGLENPRGLAVLSNGRLLLAQAGTGNSASQTHGLSGRLSLLSDWNNDGDYDDTAEIIDVQKDLPSYNIFFQSNPGRDEVVGIGDVIALADDRSLLYDRRQLQAAWPSSSLRRTSQALHATSISAKAL